MRLYRIGAAMSEMGQKSPRRSDALCSLHRFGDAEMRRMRRRKKRVEHEHLHAFQDFHRFRGQLFRIRHVAEIAESVSVDRHRAVGERK